MIILKKIETTVAKAKALRTCRAFNAKSKSDTTIQEDKFSRYSKINSVNELFNNVSEKIADRPGGYTRIVKMGNRLGDNAEMCVIELVDYNLLYLVVKRIRKQSLKKKKKKDFKKPVDDKSIASK